MTLSDVTVRPATADDESAVVELWHACKLTVPYNDPASDFRFARAKENSDILLGIDKSGAIVGSVLVGHDGHRGWVYYVAAHRIVAAKGSGGR